MYTGYTALPDGTILGLKGKPIQAWLFKGYLHVNIRTHKVPVHRVIATLLIPNPHNKPDIHHINGDKLDNRVENLTWVSRAEHRALHHKDLNVQSKLNWDRVDYIRANLHKPTTLLAKELNVSPTAISLVKHNKTWKQERHPKNTCY